MIYSPDWSKRPIGEEKKIRRSLQEDLTLRQAIEDFFATLTHVVLP